MKMSRKALSVLLLLVLLVSSFLTGCGGNDPAPLAGPDEVAVALFDLMMKNDASGAQKALGYESEEAVWEDIGSNENFYNDIVDGIVAQFEDALGVTASDEDTKALLDALVNMMSKLQFSAEVKKQNDKERTAVVTCTVSQLDMAAFNNAMANAVIEPMSSGISDADDLLSIIIRSMTTTLDTLEPTNQAKSFDVDFELKVLEINGTPQEIWVPTDAGTFGDAITTAAMGD